MSAPVPPVRFMRCTKQHDAIVEPCAGAPGCSNLRFNQEDHDYFGGHLVCESVEPRFRDLIAAAPLLLACLKEAVASWELADEDPDAESGDGEALAAWKAAIAKAEGR